jgi:uncharacterized protein YjeT (DUF2065 family)
MIELPSLWSWRPTLPAISLRLTSQTIGLPRLICAEEEVTMRNMLTWILGFGLTINGIAMLAAPAAWYMAVPGVAETGPFNPHFVRDIGSVYLAAGAFFLWFAVRPGAWTAAKAGAAFLTLHALIHIWDIAAGREHAHQQLLTDLAAVFLPSVLAIWIVWPQPSLYRGEMR